MNRPRQSCSAATLLLGLTLLSCGRQADEETVSAPVIAPPDPEIVEEPLNPHLAVDEPLPPFDELSAVPEVVAEGSFEGHSPHAAAGEFRIYQVPGDRLLRIENLQVADRERLQLVLLHRNGQADRALLVAPLKGSSGNQNYLMDPGVNLRDFVAVAVVAADRSEIYARAPLSFPPKAGSGRA